MRLILNTLFLKIMRDNLMRIIGADVSALLGHFHFGLTYIKRIEFPYFILHINKTVINLSIT